MAAALVLRAVLGGWGGLESGVIGIVVASGALFLMFLLKGIAGGDVKLMATVGAWAGAKQAFPIFLAVAVAGGMLATYYVWVDNKLRRMARSNAISGDLRADRHLCAERPAPTVPFGIAIALGTVLCAAGNALLWR